MKAIVRVVIAMILGSYGEVRASDSKIVLSEPDRVQSVVVYIPEQIMMVGDCQVSAIDQPWIVQGLVEKALIDAGYRVLDLPSVIEPAGTNSIAGKSTVTERAVALGATYVVSGQATAFQPTAEGRKSAKATAAVSVRLIRVSDGEILGVEQAMSKGGAIVQTTGAQGALQEAGEGLAPLLIQRLGIR